MFVERQVRDEALESAILVLKRSQPTQLAHAEMRVLLLPDVEGGLTPSWRQTSAGGDPLSTWRSA